MIPKYADIEAPLARELARRGGSARPADCDESGRSVYMALADYFSLSSTDLAEVIYEKGASRSKWENMVRYAVRTLRKNCVIERGGAHGVWTLTEKAVRGL